jgi:CheY-like chemotaxis protein
MEMICESCKARLNVPDEKIPKDQAVTITCPKCRNRITLETRRAERKAEPSGSKELPDTKRASLRSPDSRSARKESQESYGYEDYAGDEALEFFEEGVKLALVMANSPEQGEKITPALAQLGYKVISTTDTRDAIGKARFHHFDMIILMDGFDSQPLEHSTVVNYLNRLSMSIRRRIFVALISDKFKTMDDMMAFAMSANVVINTKDLEKLFPVLKKAITENEKFYKVFFDTLPETGKA